MAETLAQPIHSAPLPNVLKRPRGPLKHWSDLARVTCPRCLQSAAGSKPLENEQKPEESQVKIERFTRNLRVTLSETEVVERAKRSAYLLGEIQQKSDERDAAKKQANAQIEELEAEMHRLSLEVRDGGTYRDVPCERRYLYRTGNVVEVRTDTKDVLTERAMTDRERQLELGNVAKPDATKTEGKPDDGVVPNDYKPDGPTEKPKRGGRKPKNQPGAQA